MKYFSVTKLELSGMLKTGEIYSDGTCVNDAKDVQALSITFGYDVSEYDERGELQRVMFYPVKIDVEACTTNEEKVLNTIKAIYTPEDGWQNNNW